VTSGRAERLQQSSPVGSEKYGSQSTSTDVEPRRLLRGGKRENSGRGEGRRVEARTGAGRRIGTKATRRAIGATARSTSGRSCTGRVAQAWRKGAAQGSPGEKNRAEGRAVSHRAAAQTGGAAGRARAHPRRAVRHERIAAVGGGRHQTSNRTSCGKDGVMSLKRRQGRSARAKNGDVPGTAKRSQSPPGKSLEQGTGEDTAADATRAGN